MYFVLDPIDFHTDHCHMTWLIRDYRHLLKVLINATCSNGTEFKDLNLRGFDDCSCQVIKNQINFSTDCNDVNSSH